MTQLAGSPRRGVTLGSRCQLPMNHGNSGTIAAETVLPVAALGAGGQRGGGSMSSNDLLGLLEERAEAGTGPVLARTRGSIVFDAGPEGAWTLLLDRGTVRLQHGPIDEPTSTISASLPVLRSVIEGTRSGIE